MIAYELREEYQGTVEQVLTVDEKGDPVDTVTVPAFTGGVVRAGDVDLNIVEELEAGNGRIVIDEATIDGNQAVNVLDHYPALKRVAVEADDEPADRVGGDKTSAELRADAKALGIKIAVGADRDAVAAGLNEQAARAGGGDLLVVPGEERTVTITKDGTLAVESTNAGEAS